MKEMHDMDMLLLQQDEIVMSLNAVATPSFFPSHISFLLSASFTFSLT